VDGRSPRFGGSGGRLTKGIRRVQGSEDRVCHHCQYRERRGETRQGRVEHHSVNGARHHRRASASGGEVEHAKASKFCLGRGDRGAAGGSSGKGSDGTCKKILESATDFGWSAGHSRTPEQ